MRRFLFRVRYMAKMRRSGRPWGYTLRDEWGMSADAYGPREETAS